MEVFNIGNRYLTAPTAEKLYVILEEEFGNNKGRTALIKCTLYGLTTNGVDYMNYFANVLHEMGLSYS